MEEEPPREKGLMYHLVQGHRTLYSIPYGVIVWKRIFRFYTSLSTDCSAKLKSFTRQKISVFAIETIHPLSKCHTTGLNVSPVRYSSTILSRISKPIKEFHPGLKVQQGFITTLQRFWPYNWIFKYWNRHKNGKLQCNQIRNYWEKSSFDKDWTDIMKQY